MKKYRSYKYLIKPSEEQKEKIKKIFAYVRIVHNLYVCDVKEGRNINCLAKEILPTYIKENPKLKEVDTSALMNKLFQLQESKDKLSYAHKKQINSYTTSNLYIGNGTIIYKGDYVNLPMLKDVEIINHRPLMENSRICKATIKKDNLDKYYISILVSYEWTNPKNKLDLENSIGLDYSSPNFYVDNNGHSPDKTRFYYDIEKRVTKLHRILDSCERGSNNYKRCKEKIAKIYKRCANQRNDFLHKESKRIADKYDIVCVEDIDMVDMSHKLNLAKRTYDNSYGSFVTLLKYKLEEQGKVLVKVKRQYPSSRICHICNHEYKELTINDREWICPNCHNKLDRDINAAINIRKEGIRQLSCRRAFG